MAKKQDAPPSSLLDSYLANAQRDQKSAMYTADEHGSRIVGIPIYPIALAWLIHCDVMPLQSIITLSAEPKCYKTSTVFDFMRMFGISPQWNGIGIYINTEGKLSPTKIKSLIPAEFVNKIQVHSARGTDGPNGWQSYATYHLESVTNAMHDIAKRRKSGEKTYMPPIIMAIDSLGGTQTTNIEEKIADDAQGRGYQDRAYLNTLWLNSWSARMVGLPVLLILVNHLKHSMDGFGMTSPGGVAPSFHTSLEIRIRRAKKDEKKINGEVGEVTALEWQVFFSSIGRDARRIKINYNDTYDAAGNQVCWFDWDDALVQLIITLQAHNNSEYPGLRETLQIEAHDCGNLGKMYTCPMVNVNTKEQAKDQKITSSVLGQMLSNNPEIRSFLMSALKIQHFNYWSPDFEMPPIPAVVEKKKK